MKNDHLPETGSPAIIIRHETQGKVVDREELTDAISDQIRFNWVIALSKVARYPYTHAGGSLIIATFQMAAGWSGVRNHAMEKKDDTIRVVPKMADSSVSFSAWS